MICACQCQKRPRRSSLQQKNNKYTGTKESKIGPVSGASSHATQGASYAFLLRSKKKKTRRAYTWPLNAFSTNLQLRGSGSLSAGLEMHTQFLPPGKTHLISELGNLHGQSTGLLTHASVSSQMYPLQLQLSQVSSNQDPSALG